MNINPVICELAFLSVQPTPVHPTIFSHLSIPPSSEHRRADVSGKSAHVTDNMSAQASYGIYAHDNHITASDLDTATDGKQVDHHGNGAHGGNKASLVHCPKNSTKPYAIDVGVKQYWCSKPVIVNGTIIEGSYNEGVCVCVCVDVCVCVCIWMFICGCMYV